MLLFGLPEEHQLNVVRRFLRSRRSKDELLLFVNTQGILDFDSRDIPLLNDLVIKELILNHTLTLTNKERLELMYRASDPGVISELAEGVLRNNPAEEELHTLAAQEWLFDTYGLPYNSIATSILHGLGVSKRKDMLRKMGIPSYLVWN